MSEPYTVADLRRWANEYRARANFYAAEGRRMRGRGKANTYLARGYEDDAVKGRAQAAAFDALADRLVVEDEEGKP